jgi:hypothetical protein
MRALVLGAMLSGLLIACGGSEPDTGRDEYVRRVDALCRQTRPQLAEINTALIRARDASRSGQVSASKTFLTFATLLGRAKTVTGELRAGLRKITPPAADRDFHDQLVDSIEQGEANVEKQIVAAERRDADALRDLSVQGTTLNARTKGLVAGHGGFRFCGQS